MSGSDVRSHEDPGASTVSVVIPTLNRARLLERILPAYLNQGPRIHEVIVVDDGSEDDTRSVLASFGPRVRAIHNGERRGASFAENRGIEASTGDLVFIGEDDLEPDEGHIETLRAHLLATGADVICGRRVNVYEGETREEALRRASRRRVAPVDRHHLLERSFTTWDRDLITPITGPCMLIRRNVLQQVRYDESFTDSGWRQETDFQLSAAAAGFTLSMCPHTVGFHHPRTIATGKHVGGARSGRRVSYEMQVARNNLYLLRKHWPFLSDPNGPIRMRSLPLAFARQLAGRVLLGVRKGSAFARAKLVGGPPDWN